MRAIIGLFRSTWIPLSSMYMPGMSAQLACVPKSTRIRSAALNLLKPLALIAPLVLSTNCTQPSSSKAACPSKIGGFRGSALALEVPGDRLPDRLLRVRIRQRRRNPGNAAPTRGLADLLTSSPC